MSCNRRSLLASIFAKYTYTFCVYMTELKEIQPEVIQRRFQPLSLNSITLLTSAANDATDDQQVRNEECLHFIFPQQICVVQGRYRCSRVLFSPIDLSSKTKNLQEARVPGKHAFAGFPFRAVNAVALVLLTGMKNANHKNIPQKYPEEDMPLCSFCQRRKSRTIP